MSPDKNFKSMYFEPNIDLTPQFTFNTKQIFLYLTIRAGEKEEMVWSKIVRNGDEYRFFSKQASNYIFSAPELRTCELELRGNVFPYVGQILDVSYGAIKYIVPN